MRYLLESGWHEWFKFHIWGYNLDERMQIEIAGQTYDFDDKSEGYEIIQGFLNRGWIKGEGNSKRFYALLDELLGN